MYDGQWMDGKMAGRGRYYFGGKNNDGDMWDGTFVENELHGLGTYNYNYQRIDPATGKKGRPPREAIYHRANASVSLTNCDMGHISNWRLVCARTLNVHATVLNAPNESA